MNLRFPHPGAGGHEMASPGAYDSPEITGARSVPEERLSVPDRACCCTARPVAKIVMPPVSGRPHPVDLWLCGHHWRASRQVLRAAGATVYQVAAPTGEPLPQWETAAA